MATNVSCGPISRQLRAATLNFEELTVVEMDFEKSD